jgi:hypothetical protein
MFVATVFIAGPSRVVRRVRLFDERADLVEDCGPPALAVLDDHLNTLFG